MARAMSKSAAAKFLGEQVAARGLGKPALGIRVLNAKEFQSSVKRYSKSFLKVLLHEAKGIMTRIEREAKRRAPVDMGFLRASITWDVVLQGMRVIGRIGSSVHYAKYVEFPRKGVQGRTGGGTVDDPFTSWRALKARGGSGQTMPFLRPAAKKVLIQHAKAAVQRALKTAKG